MRPNPTGLAEALIRAAEIIETNGLHKGAFVAPASVPDRHGRLHVDDLALRPVDMVGAIRIAYGSSPEDLSNLDANQAVRFVSERSELLNGEAPLSTGTPDDEGYWEHLAGWNDAPERTALEVAARLRRIAGDADMAAALAVA
jgi:hypothetical protein